MVLDPNGFSNSNTLGDLRIKAVARGPWTDGDKCFMKTVLKDLYYYGRFAVWKAIDPCWESLWQGCCSCRQHRPQRDP